MSEGLTYAAVRACVRLYECLEWMTENETVEHAFMHCEIQCELSDIFDTLTTQLSEKLKTDATKLVQDVIEAELKIARALIRAAGQTDHG